VDKLAIPKIGCVEIRQRFKAIPSSRKDSILNVLNPMRKHCI